MNGTTTKPPKPDDGCEPGEPQSNGLARVANRGGVASEAAPGRRWGRFRELGLLGSGGMGEVYEAEDPHLRRRVAVKVLRDDRPEAVRRFTREARAQAKVEHRCICPIFEVGQAEGKPYIVMQLIKGRPLTEAAAEMSLEQQLVVMAEVAGAVHEAHRAGLIHRDLKPSNIMVEETEDGEYRPYVVDFGIARWSSDPGLTTEGSFLGTPAYSAPEQVRGDSQAVDRRTDVYSLGATLYSLLAGGPPFVGPTPTVLLEVLETVPRPLSRLGVPAEVETITMTCLAKEPQQRYLSAKTFAEDLQRYLDGEPILARPIGLGQRLLRRALKHRALVAITGVALVLVACALVWGSLSRWQARTRERLILELLTQVTAIEAELRFSALVPRHDIRPDRERLAGRMAVIRQQIEHHRGLAEGPGSYALGRALLAQDELSAARHHLEVAWRSGYQEPEVAHALGLTLSLQLQQGLAEAELLTDADLRQQRRRELQEQYQQPAVRYMVLSLGHDPQADSYLRALIAYHQGQLERALELVAAAEAGSPWLHEAALLRGEIHRARADRYRQSGAADQEEQAIRQALEAFSDAATIAESDLSSYLAAGQVQVRRMQRAELATQDLSGLLTAGLQQAENAITIDPDDQRGWLLKAVLWFRIAEHQRLANQDPGTALHQALVAASEAATVAEGTTTEPWRLIGQLHASWAFWHQALGDGDAQQSSLDQAFEALARVSENDRYYAYFNTLASSYLGLGMLRSERGTSPRTAYSRSFEAYEQAIRLHPNPIAASNGLYSCLSQLLALPETGNRIELLTQAAGLLEQARQKNPTHPVPYYNLGRCLVRLAQGGDVHTGALGEEIEQAIAVYRKGLELLPDRPFFYSAIGEAMYFKALNAWDNGHDPEPFFAEAEQVYRQGLEVDPEFAILYGNLAWTYYHRGKLRVLSGRDPGQALARAIMTAQQVLDQKQDVQALQCLGSAYRMLAEHDLRTGRDPGPHLRLAKQAFRAMLDHAPDSVEAFHSLGLLLTLEARNLAEGSGDPEPAFAAAQQYLAQALARKQGSPLLRLATAEHHYHHAVWLSQTGSTPAHAVDQGLVQTQLALNLRPDLAEALAIEACLLNLRALTSDQASEELALQAAGKLRQALTANPNLKLTWGSCLQLPGSPATPPIHR